MAGIKKLVDPRGAFLLGAPAVAEVPAAGGDGGGAAPLPAGLKGEEERATHVGGAAPGGLRAGRGARALAPRARRGSDIGSITVDSEAGTARPRAWGWMARRCTSTCRISRWASRRKRKPSGAPRGSWGSFSQDLGVAGGRENGTGSKRRSFPD